MEIINQLTEDQIRRSALHPTGGLSAEETKRYLTWAVNGPDSLDLTPEEEEEVKRVAVEAAIAQAKIQKGYKEYKRLYGVYTTSTRVYPTFTSSQFGDVVLQMGLARSRERAWRKPFSLNKDNTAIFNLLCHYFTGNEKFETVRGYSLNKGILLIGPVGCGKTHLMELFSKNPKMCYTRHDCLDIAGLFSEKEKGGQGVIDDFSFNSKSTNVELSMGQDWYGRFFDDLGTETNTKHFGNERNVMADIIQKRHKMHPFHMTHFTSNLVMSEIKEMYGERVHDRLTEMCNVVNFSADAKSLRS